jgi:hypothetical protein
MPHCPIATGGGGGQQQLHAIHNCLDMQVHGPHAHCLYQLEQEVAAPASHPALGIPQSPIVGGDVKQMEWVPIKLTHALGNACISRRSIRTPTADGPKKEVGFAVDVAVRALLGKLQQAPIKIVDGRPWSPGVYQLLCLLGKTLEVAWVRAFI